MKWKESEAGIKMKNYSNDESHCDKLVEMEKNESFPTGLIQVSFFLVIIIHFEISFFPLMMSLCRQLLLKA